MNCWITLNFRELPWGTVSSPRRHLLPVDCWIVKLLWQNKFLCAKLYCSWVMVIWTVQNFQINLFSCKDEPWLCMSYLCRIAAAKLYGILVQFVSCLLYGIKHNLNLNTTSVFKKLYYREIFWSKYSAVRPNMAHWLQRNFMIYLMYNN
jgi:hypothetical protein